MSLCGCVRTYIRVSFVCVHYVCLCLAIMHARAHALNNASVYANKLAYI